MLESGIEVYVIETDDDYVKLRVVASSGTFAGQADVSDTCESVSESARMLRGFPANHRDTRELEFGNFSDGYAGGAVRLKFFCVDAAGHAAADVTFRDKVYFDDDFRIESAEFRIRIAAIAVDSFVVQLLRMAADVEQAAHVGQIARLAATLP